MDNVTEVMGPNETVEAVPNGTPEVVDDAVNKSPDENDRVDNEVSTDAGENRSDGHNGSEDADTFPRSYVEKLRKSEASYREKAKRAGELEKRLHAALVAKDGRLADPGDLEFNPEHLEDEGALAAAISELITRKPGLRAQQLRGDVGAGTRGGKPKPPMDLISIMKGMK